MGDDRAFVYLLKCNDGTLYCGWTNDPAKRLQTHQSGKGAKYTRMRLPVDMICLVQCKDRRDAMSLEFNLKHGPRCRKLELIEDEKNLLKGKKLEDLDL